MRRGADGSQRRGRRVAVTSAALLLLVAGWVGFTVLPGLVTEESISALGAIGPAAREAAPALARIVRSGPGELQWEAAGSLARIGE